MKRLSILCLCLIFLVLAGCGTANNNSDAESNVSSAVSDSENMDLYAGGKMSEKATIEIKDMDDKVLIDKKDIDVINVYSEQDGYFSVVVKFTEEGKDKFAAVTKENIGKRIAFHVNGKFLTSTTVGAEVTAGRVVILRHYIQEEVMEFYNSLTK